MNDAIPEHLCSVHYMSFDRAMALVKGCDIGAELVKYDIKSAFCLLPVHPANFELLGFSFDSLF